jgi:hypothetical protein
MAALGTVFLLRERSFLTSLEVAQKGIRNRALFPVTTVVLFLPFLIPLESVSPVVVCLTQEVQAGRQLPRGRHAARRVPGPVGQRQNIFSSN